MCLRLAWRREEGNTHRVSQACPEHEPTFRHTHCTPAFSLSNLAPEYNHTQMQRNVRGNFYIANKKFMQSHTVVVSQLQSWEHPSKCFSLALCSPAWHIKVLQTKEMCVWFSDAVLCSLLSVHSSSNALILRSICWRTGYHIQENATHVCDV